MVCVWLDYSSRRFITHMSLQISHRNLVKCPFPGERVVMGVGTGASILQIAASWRIGSFASQKIHQINYGHSNLNVGDNIRLIESTANFFLNFPGT